MLMPLLMLYLSLFLDGSLDSWIGLEYIVNRWNRGKGQPVLAIDSVVPCVMVLDSAPIAAAGESNARVRNIVGPLVPKSSTGVGSARC